jgi:hypothetical protein
MDIHIKNVNTLSIANFISILGSGIFRLAICRQDKIKHAVIANMYSCLPNDIDIPRSILSIDSHCAFSSYGHSVIDEITKRKSAPKDPMQDDLLSQKAPSAPEIANDKMAINGLETPVIMFVHPTRRQAYHRSAADS